MKTFASSPIPLLLRLHVAYVLVVVDPFFDKRVGSVDEAEFEVIQSSKIRHCGEYHQLWS